MGKRTQDKILDALNNYRPVNPNWRRGEYKCTWRLVENWSGVYDDIRYYISKGEHSLIIRGNCFVYYDGPYRIVAFWAVEKETDTHEHLYMKYGCECHGVSRWPHATKAKFWNHTDIMIDTMADHTRQLAEHIRECMGE